jgi:malate permease and related proteins
VSGAKDQTGQPAARFTASRLLFFHCRSCGGSESSAAGMHIINSLAPVFLLIALGALLVRSSFLSKDVLRGMNDLAYWVGLPALIFRELARADFGSDGFWTVLGIFLAGTFAAIVVSAIAGRLLRLPRASRGTFIQAGFRGNLAFIGLPVVMFAFGDAALPDPRQPLEAAVLVLAPIMVVYNVVSVLALYASHATNTAQVVKKTARQLVTNPLIIASLAGVASALLQVSFPPAIDRSLTALSQLALPLALLCIGGSLVIVPVKGSLGCAFSAALIKVAVAPIVGLLAGLALDVDRHLMMVALIYLACPTAAASYILARQLGGDEALAASTVVVSTVLALVSLSAVVALL